LPSAIRYIHAIFTSYHRLGAVSPHGLKPPSKGDGMNRDELKKLLWKLFGHLTQLQMMALTIFGEARGESRDGRIAVGSVILKRVECREWDGETIHEVCLMPFQFSCYLPSDPNLKLLQQIADAWDDFHAKSATLRQCCDIAAGLLDGTIERNVDALQYVNPRTVKMMPAWTKTMKLVAAIGHHVFYT